MSSLQALNSYRAKSISLFFPFILVAVISGINIILGIGRDMVLTAKFGASSDLDAFLLGFNFIRTLGIQVAISTSNILVPVFIPLWLNNQLNAISEISIRWMRTTSHFLLFCLLLLSFFPQQIARWLGPGLSDDGQQVLVKTLLLLAPLLFIFIIEGNLKAFADSRKSYALHGAFLSFIPVGIIVGTILGADKWGTTSTAIGVVLGAFSGLAILVGVLIGKFANQFSMLTKAPKTAGKNPEIIAINFIPYTAFGLMLISSLLIITQGIIERAFASQLSPGSVVIYSLAISILGIPSALLIPSLSAILLPTFVYRQTLPVSKKFYRKFGLLKNELMLIIGLFILLTSFFWIGSEKIVDLLFLHGNFPQSAAQQTATTVKGLSISLIGYGLTTVFRQALISQKKIFADLIICCLITLLTVSLLNILVPRFGLIGLVIEGIVTMTSSAGLYAMVLKFGRPQ